MKLDLYKLQQEVSKKLTSKRFYHTLGVSATSFSLALTHGDDPIKATYAGVLHDYAKCMKDEELLFECEKYHLSISDVERRNPYLLHGKLGAYYAKERFEITDVDILSAITYHTTGRPNMSLLEKIVFVADFIEPGRNQERIPRLKQIREVAFKDIDGAVYEILDNTLKYLENQLTQIDNLTVDAYNYYKE